MTVEFMVYLENILVVVLLSVSVSPIFKQTSNFTHSSIKSGHKWSVTHNAQIFDHVDHVPNCMICLNAIVVITGRTHGSHDRRVLKMFPGPGYLGLEDGVVWLWHFLVNL